jgi:hypothetical protein
MPGENRFVLRFRGYSYVGVGSVMEGERLIKSVYEAIRASPVWDSSLFIITYDEHGGFYDHVNPNDLGPVPAPDDNVNKATGFAFDRLGVRVPTVVISPFVTRGSVVNSRKLHRERAVRDLPFPNSQFESTSIMATTSKILNITAAPLGNRAAWAATFTSILRPENYRNDCIETLPELPSLQAVLRETNAYEVQRKKPLNEHLESQLMFYCNQNNAHSKQDQEDCLGYVTKHCTNQGEASDWIVDQVAIYTTKLRAAEAAYSAAHAQSK